MQSTTNIARKGLTKRLPLLTIILVVRVKALTLSCRHLAEGTGHHHVFAESIAFKSA